MVVTQTLAATSISTIRCVFNEAFSDYEVPVQMNEDQFHLHLESLGYSPEDSLGLFADALLVGFLLIARRGNIAYDCGTGIIPTYRGKRFGHLLLEQGFQHLSKQGCTTFLLEVLDTNTRAKTLYAAHGCKEKRKLFCYKAQRQTVAEKPNTLTLCNQTTTHIPDNPYAPSWQNSTQSILEGAYSIQDIMKNGQPIGVVCYRPSTGSIAQIYLKEPYWNIEYCKQAIVSCAHNANSNALRCINVDNSNQVLIKTLESLDFIQFTSQSEMVADLGTV